MNSGDVNSSAYRLYSSQTEEYITPTRGGHDMHISIRIKGDLDPSWQQGLEGLQIVHEEQGTSLLSGVLKDQAALFGVLKRIDHLSLTLLSLERTDPEGPGA
jgi:hypothetical protein